MLSNCDHFAARRNENWVNACLPQTCVTAERPFGEKGEQPSRLTAAPNDLDLELADLLAQGVPVEAKQLVNFHQNEKPAVANAIAAWASQTGKGLLFITKRAEDKAHPGHIINLVSCEVVSHDKQYEL